MKKYVVLIMAIAFSAFSFAQKSELKGAEKALKSSNYASAKTFIKSAESMEGSMDDKTKAKFYYLKGKTYFANGKSSESDTQVAVESFKKVKEIEEKLGKKTYTPKVEALETEMLNGFLTKAQSSLKSKDYETSYKNFERVYRLSPKDTSFLYNAAILASQSESYDKSLSLFNELLDLGYTGITPVYYAVNVETGVKEPFTSNALRTAAVRTKSHKNPTNGKSQSNVGEIYKNIAIIYIAKDEQEKAVEAIEKARKQDPEDITLIEAEASIRYKLGQIDRYKELVQLSIERDPNNPILFYNLGIVASQANEFDEAKMRFEKAIQLDPSYVDAHIQLGALILSQEADIIEEMNNLGSSAADDKRYEELKVERKNLYLDAIPHLENALELDPNNLGAATTLMNIYSALDETEKFKTMKAKVEAIESAN